MRKLKCEAYWILSELGFLGKKLASEVSFAFINVKGNNQLDLLITRFVGITVNV